MTYYITHTGKLMEGNPPANTRFVSDDPREALMAALAYAVEQQNIISNRQRNLDRRVANIRKGLKQHGV